MSPSGPTRRSADGPWNGDNPPILANFSGEPKYDLQMIVSLTKVRPMILWGWEQQLGVPPAPRPEDEGSLGTRRYSERDLIALLWLREQIIKGRAPSDAAAMLHAAQERGAAPPSSSFSRGGATPQGAPPERQPLATRPLTRPLWGEAWSERPENLSRPLGRNSMPVTREGGVQSGAILPEFGPNSSFPPQTGVFTPTQQANDLPSAADHAPASGSPWGGGEASPLGQANPRPLVTASTPASGGFSLPDLSRAAGTGSVSGGVGPGPFPEAGAEYRGLLAQLIRALIGFNTLAADRVVESALATRTIETVCMGLLQPALARLGEMRARHEVNSPEERFAQHYVRGVLFSIFRAAQERPDGPLVLVGCGPREQSEVGALMLAVFWRLAGKRVVYLGPDVEGSGLVEKVRKERAREQLPRLISLSVTTSQRIRTLGRLAKEFARLEAPRPIFAYWGPVFEKNPELTKRVTGVYLGADPWQATWHLTQLLGQRQRVPTGQLTRYPQHSLGG
jgi:methanogenic corrinoid protein MtbC1